MLDPSNPTTTYDDTRLETTYSNFPTFAATRRVLLQFDLATQTEPLNGAHLILKVVETNLPAGSSVTLALYSTTDEWDESTLTWEGRLMPGNLLESRTVAAGDNGAVVFANAAVGDYLEAERNGDQVASFLVQLEGGSGALGFAGSLLFEDREGSHDGVNGNEPYIEPPLPQNRAPLAQDDRATTDEDTPLTLTPLANDSDPDNDPLSLLAFTTPAHGSLLGVGNSLIFTPTADFYGNSTFAYTITDGSLTATAQVTVTVIPVNDPPQAVDDQATTNENQAVTINVLQNDSDVDNDTLTISSVGASAQGAVSQENDALLFTPTHHFNGMAVFTYTVSDSALEASARVTVTVLPVYEAPIITATVSGTLGSNQWYVTDLLVSWLVDDNGAPISSQTGCDPSTVSSDTSGVTFTCAATNAGGSSSQSVTIQRDATAPIIAFANRTPPNANGWNNSDVTLTWHCSDATAGAVTPSVSQTVSSEGANQSATGSCTDNAGNRVADTQSAINIDKSKPTISAAATTNPNGAGWYNSTVTVHFTCADNAGGSGLAVTACPADEVLATEGNAVAATAQTVNDLAENSSDPSNVITVPIDKSAPTLNPTVNPNPVPVGGAATVTAGATDALSGLAGQSCGLLDTSTPGVKSVTCTASDNADNTASATVTYTVQAAGILVGSCGGYDVYQTGSVYTASGWSGTIKVGTNGNNTLNGTNGRDLMLGLGGNDLLKGNGGDDLLCGGDGVDLVQGFAGNDLLDGGAGNDVVNGGSGDYDQLVAGAGNDTLLDGDGVSNAAGGAGNDLFTLALRNGWRDPNGQRRFAGLAAGYDNDVVGLAILTTARFFVDISGDERDMPASPLEGNNDHLALAGVIDPASILIKFEHRVVLSADAAVEIPSEEAGAEYLNEPVGDEEQGEDMVNRLFLPMINR